MHRLVAKLLENAANLCRPSAWGAPPDVLFAMARIHTFSSEGPRTPTGNMDLRKSVMEKEASFPKRGSYIVCKRQWLNVVNCALLHSTWLHGTKGPQHFCSVEAIEQRIAREVKELEKRGGPLSFAGLLAAATESSRETAVRRVRVCSRVHTTVPTHAGASTFFQ